MAKNRDVTPETVATLWEREKGSCARCGRGLIRTQRGAEWSVHHRGGRGNTWSNTLPALVILCGTGVTGCHGWVTENPRDAKATGWSVNRLGRNTTTEIAILHYHHGYGHLTNDPEHPFRKETT